MNTHKVKEIFIGDGTTLDTDATSISAISAQLNFVGGDMTVAKGGSITITTDPILYAVNKLADGTLKRSFPIKGQNVSAFKAEQYRPAKRNVWAIGHNRATAVGTIEVNNDTLYTARIVFKNDKTFYSERPEALNISFTSAAAATQLTIATQIAAAINNSAWGSSVSGVKELIAVVVGDGTGVYGLTGATDYGVEITGLTINQFQNTSYTENLVYFSTHVNDASGFGTTTTCTEIQAFAKGNGTYNQIYNEENFDFGYEGVLNRTKWPVPTLAYLASSTGVTSAALAAFTASGTISEDQVTFSAAASTQLPAGSFILLDGVAYEIKYYISTTVAVLTTVLSATIAAVEVKGKAWYDVINILVDDVTTTPGANVGQFSKKAIMIATPAISASSTAMTTAPTGTSDLVTLLNAYMTTTPGAFANISL